MLSRMVRSFVRGDGKASELDGAIDKLVGAKDVLVGVNIASCCTGTAPAFIPDVDAPKGLEKVTGPRTELPLNGGG